MKESAEQGTKMGQAAFQSVAKSGFVHLLFHYTKSVCGITKKIITIQNQNKILLLLFLICVEKATTIHYNEWLERKNKTAINK